MIYFCVLAFTASVSASTGGPDNCVLGAFNEHVQRIDSSLSLSPTIIQVGANLAFKNPTDPLRKLYEMNAERRAKVRLVLVEPVPSTAALLRNLTRGYDYVSVHEAAACPNDADKVAFWTINEEALHGRRQPFFARSNQIASMSKAHLLHHRAFIPGLKSSLRQIDVRCHTVHTIMRLNSVMPRDLLGLIIDAEGRDDRVFAGIDLLRLRPHMLAYERINLGFKANARLLCELGRHGYFCSQQLDVENVWCTRSPEFGGWGLLEQCGVVKRSAFKNWSTHPLMDISCSPDSVKPGYTTLAQRQAASAQGFDSRNQIEWP